MPIVPPGTSLDPEVNQRWRAALRRGDLDSVERWLPIEAFDLHNRKGIDGEYPAAALDLAVFSGKPALVQRLLDLGAPLNAHNDLGMTALHSAACRTSVKTLQVLIAAGAALDAQNTNGYTALMYAAETGVDAPVELLLAAGASVHVRDHDFKTALHHAVEHSVNAPLAIRLIAAGCDPWAQDTRGRTVVHALCQRSPGPVLLDHLIALAADQGRAWNVPDEKGWKPLHVAISEGQSRMVRTLLERGVQPDEITMQGVTARDLAVELQEPDPLAVIEAALIEREQAALRSVLPTDGPVMERPPRRL